MSPYSSPASPLIRSIFRRFSVDTNPLGKYLGLTRQLHPVASCGKIGFSLLPRRVELPHTYHRMVVNPSCDETREIVEGAASANKGELDRFHCFEEQQRAQAFVEFASLDEARAKLTPMVRYLTEHGVQTVANGVVDDYYELADFVIGREDLR
jgi:hypothetical protein